MSELINRREIVRNSAQREVHRDRGEPRGGEKCRHDFIEVGRGDGRNTSAYPFGSNFREESQSDKASQRVASVAAGREKRRG